MDNIFNKYPWLPYILIAAIVLPVCSYATYYIWYNYYDVSYVTGKVESFSWQMDVDEYRLTTHNKSDWIDELEDGSYDLDCSIEDRTIREKQPDGSIVEYETEDYYCDYKVDTWDYQTTHSNKGTDKNPFYLPHPANSSKVEYLEQPGVFTVYFSSVEYVDGQFSFNYDQQTWNSFQEGMRVRVGVSRKGTVPHKPELPQ